MTDERKDGKTPPAKNGGKKEIPEFLPFIFSRGSYVTFPIGEFVVLNQRTSEKTKSMFNSAVVKLIKNIGYAVLATAQDDGTDPPAAVLAEIREIKEEGGKLLIEVRPFKRVYYFDTREMPPALNGESSLSKDKSGLFFTRWSFLEDIPVSDELASSERFLELLGLLQELFFKLNGNLGLARIVDDKRILEKISSQVSVVNKDNLSETLDGIMEILNQLSIQKGEQTINLILPSHIILSEERVAVRLQSVTALLYALIYGEMVNPSAEEESVEPPEPETAERKEHSFIQGDLAKPRQIPKRLVPSEVESAPDSLTELDWRTPSDFFTNVTKFLDHYIIGQDRAKREIAKVLLRFRLGFIDPRRPTIGGFFLGPTGVGKTEIIKVLARYLFGSPDAYTHIDCNALKEQHAGTAVLLGAPPGYIGYDETPRFSQWNLDKHHFLAALDEGQKEAIRKLDFEIRKLEEELTKNRGKGAAKIQDALFKKGEEREKVLARVGYRPGQYISLVAFDEIERAHPNLYDILLKILDDGLLQLNNGEVTNFRLSIICFTSNIYGKEILESLTGKKRIGIRSFSSEQTAMEFKKNTWREVVDAAERFFSFNPAFWGRIGKESMTVFYPLGEEHYMRILEDILIADELARDLGEKSGIRLDITERAKQYLIGEARDEINRALGARALRRIFELRVKDPIMMLLDKGDLTRGDAIWVDLKLTEEKSKSEIVIKKSRGSS